MGWVADSWTLEHEPWLSSFHTVIHILIYSLLADFRVTKTFWVGSQSGCSSSCREAGSLVPSRI